MSVENQAQCDIDAAEAPKEMPVFRYGLEYMGEILAMTRQRLAEQASRSTESPAHQTDEVA